MAPRPYRTFKRLLRQEPYDPDARDADGDGIVQEGTAWERPGGTRLVDRDGREMRRGSTAEGRPSGMRVVGRDGRPVDYTPTYERQQVQPTITNRYGVAGSLRERFGTIGDRPEEPEADPEPEVAAPDPERIRVAERVRAEKGGDRDEDVAALEVAERRALDAASNGGSSDDWLEARQRLRRAKQAAALPEGAVLRDLRESDEALERVAPDVRRDDKGRTAKVTRGDQVGDGVLGPEYRAVIEPGGVLWRGVSSEDLERIARRGVIDTDGRGAIAPDAEGVNLSDDPSVAEYYLPVDGEGVVLAIDADRVEEPFLIRPDGYVRTRRPIPADAIIDMSEPMGRMWIDGEYGGTVDYWPPDRGDWRDQGDGRRMVADRRLDQAATDRAVGEARARGDARVGDRGDTTMNFDSRFDRPGGERLFSDRDRGTDRAAKYAAARDADPQRRRELLRDALGSGRDDREAPTPRPERNRAAGEVPNPTPKKVGPPEAPKRPFSPMVPSPPPLRGRALELAEQADGDWARFGELLDEAGYVVLDYETTGLDDTDVPVQVGAVVMRDGKEVGRFNMWMNAGRRHADWSAWSRGEEGPGSGLRDENGNLLTQEYLDAQPSDVEVHQRLKEFLDTNLGEDPIIVAHNLPFDQGFLERSMRRAGFDEFAVTSGLDTLQLTRDAFPKDRDGVDGPTSHGLASIARFLGATVDTEGLHRADNDADVTRELLGRAVAKAAERGSDPGLLTAAGQEARFVRDRERYRADKARYDRELVAWERAMGDHRRARIAYDRQRAEGLADDEVELPEPRPAVEVVVADDPSLHGVERQTAQGFGNPEWARVQAAGERVGQRIRGVPISYEDERLPELLYHVTTAADGVLADGLVRAGGGGGLGGDQRDRLVSLTVDPAIADGIAEDLRLMAAAAKTDDVDGFIEVLQRDDHGDMRAYHWDYLRKLHGRQGPAQTFRQYLVTRDLQGGRKDPVIVDIDATFARMRDVDENQIGIVQVPRANLNTGAMLTDFDLGQGFLEEVRLYGDVPLDGGGRVFRDGLRNRDGVLRARANTVPSGRVPEGTVGRIREEIGLRRAEVLAEADAEIAGLRLRDELVLLQDEIDAHRDVMAVRLDAWRRGDDAAGERYVRAAAWAAGYEAMQRRLSYEEARRRDPVDREERLAEIARGIDPVTNRFRRALERAGRNRNALDDAIEELDDQVMLYEDIVDDPSLSEFDRAKAAALANSLMLLRDAYSGREWPDDGPSVDLGDLDRTVGEVRLGTPIAALGGTRPRARDAGRPLLSDPSPEGSTPRALGDNDRFRNVNDAVGFVRDGGSLEELPNELWPEALAANASPTPGVARFTLLQDGGGISPVTKVYGIGGADEPQGFVVKAHPEVGQMAREIAGWNLGVDHGLPVEGAMWTGRVRFPMIDFNYYPIADGETGGIGVVLPHALNGVPGGFVESPQYSKWDEDLLDRLEDRGLPQRVAGALHAYLTDTGDRHPGNTFSFLVEDGEAVVVPIDYGLSSAYYAPNDPIGFLRGFVDGRGFEGDNHHGDWGLTRGTALSGIEDPEVRRATARAMVDVYDELTERSAAVVGRGREAFVGRMMTGFPDGPDRDGGGRGAAAQELEQLFDTYRRRAEELRNGREAFVEWLRDLSGDVDGEV